MDFGKLTTEGFIDKCAVEDCISEADLRKNRMLAQQTFSMAGPTPESQILVKNGHHKTSSATVRIQLEVGDILFEECFKVMTNFTSLIIGLILQQQDITNSDVRQGLLNILFQFHATQVCKQHVL